MIALRILSILLAFQFFAGSIPYTPMNLQAWGSTSCKEGEQWSEAVSRCVSKDEQTKIQASNNTCSKLPTKGEQTQCYMRELQASGAPSGGSVDMSKISILLAMASLISGITTIKYLSSCGAAVSGWLMAGAAASIFIGEVMSGLKYQDQVKSAIEKFNKAAKSGEKGTDPTNAQTAAFGAMIEKEDATIAAAKTKNMFYMVSTAAYAAAGVSAALEILMSKYPGLQKLYYCPEVSAASAETAAAGSAAAAAAAAGETALMLPALTVTAAPLTLGATTAIVGTGAVLTGTVVLSSLAGSGSGNFNTNQPTEEKKPDPAPTNPPATTPPPTTQIEPSNEFENHDAHLLAFIDNYFQKKQRVPFKEYKNSSSLLAAKDWAQFHLSATETKRLIAGELYSSELAEYEYAQKAAQELHLPYSHEEFNFMKLAVVLAQQLTIPKVHSADLLKGLVMILGMGAIGYAGAVLLVGKSTMLTSLFTAPETRLALSGVMTINNVFMINHTNKEKSKSETRKKFLQGLKKQTEVAGTGLACADPKSTGCSTNTIDNGSKPTDTTFVPNGDRYGFNTNESENTRMGCMTNQGQLDESCTCKGNSSCAQIRIPQNFSAMAVGTDLASIAGTINGMNSGSLSGAQINAAANTALGAAIKLSRYKDSLINNPKNKVLRKAAERAEKLSIDSMNKLARDIANTPALMNAPIGRQGNDDLLNAKSPSAAIENLKEELKNNGLANTKGTGDIGADLGTTSLDLESATAVTDETAELASAPIDETYDLSGSEISEKKDVSIFQILSHRYQQTGIKRLRAPKVKD